MILLPGWKQDLSEQQGAASFPVEPRVLLPLLPWRELKPAPGTESTLHEEISLEQPWDFKPQLSLPDLLSTHLLTFFHLILTETKEQ